MSKGVCADNSGGNSGGNSGSDRAWQSELLQEEQVSKLVRSAEDLATVDEWASSQPLPPDEVYFDAVETADLRACKEDVATLQAELDYRSAARLARRACCGRGGGVFLCLFLRVPWRAGEGEDCMIFCCKFSFASLAAMAWTPPSWPDLAEAGITRT